MKLVILACNLTSTLRILSLYIVAIAALLSMASTGLAQTADPIYLDETNENSELSFNFLNLLDLLSAQSEGFVNKVSLDLRTRGSVNLKKSEGNRSRVSIGETHVRADINLGRSLTFTLKEVGLDRARNPKIANLPKLEKLLNTLKVGETGITFGQKNLWVSIEADATPIPNDPNFFRVTLRLSFFGNPEGTASSEKTPSGFQFAFLNSPISREPVLFRLDEIQLAIDRINLTQFSENGTIPFKINCKMGQLFKSVVQTSEAMPNSSSHQVVPWRACEADLQYAAGDRLDYGVYVSFDYEPRYELLPELDR